MKCNEFDVILFLRKNCIQKRTLYMKKYTQLREEKRVQIFKLKQNKCGIRIISKELNSDKGAISRELNRN